MDLSSLPQFFSSSELAGYEITLIDILDNKIIKTFEARKLVLSMVSKYIRVHFGKKQDPIQVENILIARNIIIVK